MIVRICVKKYGFADIEVENTSEIDDLIDDMDERDFDWSDIDTDYEIVDKFDKE